MHIDSANNRDIDTIAYDFSDIKGEIKENEPMSQHTTWKVGGEAEIYFKPQNRADLQNFLKLLKAHKPANILFLGLGSNVLIRDKGYPGIVINTVGTFKQIEVNNSERVEENALVLVTVESGVSCAKFSREMAKIGLLGAEFYSGIPGSMGGAIAMNAGAFESECWDNLVRVETIDDQGIIHQRDKSEFLVSYRQVEGLAKSSEGIREWFIKGFFKYPKNSHEVKQIKEKITQLLAKRNQTQPVQYANAGSVFKNPKGDYAARLIEACGLKGKKIGGAVVAEKHANFIINNGSANASDIEALIDFVQQEVLAHFSIRLETEVRIYGDK